MSESTRRRIRRSEAEWQRLINEQSDSGQTQAAFCAANGISMASFQNWKRRLAADVSGPWLELGTLAAYSTPSLPLIPEQACHPFQTKAATDSRAKLPPW